jgi:hypothetical protein
MATYEEHRRQLVSWRRLLVGLPALTLLLAPYLLGTRTAYPALFWGAVALLAFFGAWAAGQAGWHYWILRDA